MFLKLLASPGALMSVMGVLVFVAADTIDYWQGWLFLACYGAASIVISLWLIRNDSALLKRRMRGAPFGYGIMIVFRANSFAAASIQIFS